MIFRREHGEADVASLVERKTRFAALSCNPHRRSAPPTDRLVTALAPLPRAARRPIAFGRAPSTEGSSSRRGASPVRARR